MRKKLKSVIPSMLIALGLCLFHEGRTMEEESTAQGSERAYSTTFSDGEKGSTEEPDKKNVKFTGTDSEIVPFTNFPEDIHHLVIKQAATDNYAIGSLRMVCKTWHKIIKDNKASIKQSVDDAVYESDS